MKRLKKAKPLIFWIGGAAVLIILILAGYAVIRTQTFSDLQNRGADASWKHFESQKLGFSLRYPAPWVVELNGSAGENVAFSDPKISGEEFMVSVAAPAMESVIRNSVPVVKESPQKVGGIEGRRLEAKDPRDGSLSNMVIVVAGGRLYYFTGGTKRFDAILSSVTFVSNLTK